MIALWAVFFEWLMVSVVFEVLIKVMAWPVLSLVRFLFFSLTVGRYNLSDVPLFKAPWVRGLSAIVFVCVLFYAHIVWGSQIYGANR